MNPRFEGLPVTFKFSFLAENNLWKTEMLKKKNQIFSSNTDFAIAQNIRNGRFPVLTRFFGKPVGPSGDPL